MKSQLMILPLHFFTITIFIISSTTNGVYDGCYAGYYDTNDGYEACSTLVSCGNLTNIGYPFWGLGRPIYCGHPLLNLKCPSNNSDDFPILRMDSDDDASFHVLHINKSAPTLTIKLQLIFSIFPFRTSHRVFQDHGIFSFRGKVENIHLCCNCNSSQNNKTDDALDSCSITCLVYQINNITAYYRDDNACCQNEIVIPVLREALDNQCRNETLSTALQQGFEVDYSQDLATLCFKCESSQGRCGSSIKEQFVCFRIGEKSGKWKLKLMVGLVSSAVVPGAFFIIAILIVGICCYIKSKHCSPVLLRRRLTSSDSRNSDLEISSSFCGIPIFSYAELQEATDNFNENRVLGDGGFGIVYYGKLRDGRDVAVKRLYEKNYKRIGAFMNEIEILTRLRHCNLVSLYGCTSRHTRELLLVYEFIPNGTVADHLHGERKGSEATLSWAIRMKIAVETATALSYLHASDIIHRDVKTNNILLDNSFSVKLADFGLSRLFPFDATHVSTAPQGTPGYLDPDYHKCYQVTDKSDVYSFGIVLVELISSLPAVDISRQEGEINLADYAMNRIQHGKLNELVDRTLGFESDFKIKRMITLVAEIVFQCLQQEKELRPSMNKVLEALNQLKSLDYEALEAE